MADKTNRQPFLQALAVIVYGILVPLAVLTGLAVVLLRRYGAAFHD